MVEQVWSVASAPVGSAELNTLLADAWEPFSALLISEVQVIYLKRLDLTEEGATGVVEDVLRTAALEGKDLDAPECETCVHFRLPAQRTEREGQTIYLSECLKHNWMVKSFDTCNDHSSEGLVDD